MFIFKKILIFPNVSHLYVYYAVEQITKMYENTVIQSDPFKFAYSGRNMFGAAVAWGSVF